MIDVTITREEHERSGEYHAQVAGSDAIGRLTWAQRGGVRFAEHTLVPPVIGGQGVAARLVEALIADAREQGFKIKPVCSYVVKKFEDHPEWQDVRA